MFLTRFKTPNNLLPSLIAFLTCAGVVLTPITPANGADEDFKIHVKKGRKQNYYHMEYMLTADNLIMDEAKSALNLVNDGGHFIVHIKKDRFPVSAPACDKNIVLDMPPTESTQLSALKKIHKKRNLHNALWEVANGSRKEQKVVIELNPDIKIIDRDPIKLELTTCKIYFRTALDAYVDYVGKLE